MLISIICISLLLCACGNNDIPDEPAEAVTEVVVEAEQESEGEAEVEATETVTDDSPESEDASEEEVTVEEKEETDATSEDTTTTSGRYDMQEMTFTRDGMTIYGHVYVPEGDGPFPGVVLGHGYGANLSMMEPYAKELAKYGYAAIAIDFIGGGRGSKSDGSMMEMSVLTEAADMNTVFDEVRKLDYIDEDRMYVMGASQGGFVATYVAGTRPDDVKGLIALYPAYVLQDDSRARTKDGTEFIDEFDVMGCTISRKYDEDALSFDIYDVMADYHGEVLLIHGTKDPVVPLSYSERAAEVLDHAELIVIDGAGHGFNYKDDTYAKECIIEFMQRVEQK